MTPEQKKQIRQQNESWAAGGLRVLAVAYRPLEQMAGPAAWNWRIPVFSWA